MAQKRRPRRFLKVIQSSKLKFVMGVGLSCALATHSTWAHHGGGTGSIGGIGAIGGGSVAGGDNDGDVILIPVPIFDLNPEAPHDHGAAGHVHTGVTPGAGSETPPAEDHHDHHHDHHHGETEARTDGGDSNDHHDHHHDEENNNNNNDKHNDDKHDDESDDSHDHKRREVSWHLFPMLYVGADYYNRLIDLAVQGEEPGSKGFRYVQKRRLDVGAGVGVGLTLESVLGFGAGVGVLPMVGRSVLSDRFIPTVKAAGAVRALRIPRTAKDFSTWSKSDKLAYTSRGGLVFAAGASYFGLNAGVAYMAQGEWSTIIEKTSDTSVTVRYLKSRLQALSMSAGLGYGITPVSVGLSAFGKQDSEFAYRFDLAKPQASIALDQALAGNLLVAQQHVAQGTAVVTRVSEVETASSGSVRFMRLGLPLIVARNSVSGNMQSVSETRRFEDGSSASTWAWMDMDTVMTSGLASSNRAEVTHSMGAFQKSTDKDGKTDDTHIAEAIDLYEKDRIQNSEIKGFVNRVSARTGLQMIRSATQLRREGRFGRASLSLRIGHHAVHQLIESANADASLKTVGGSKFNQALNLVVENSVSQKDDRNLFCAEGESNAVCTQRLKVRAAPVAKALVTALREARAAGHERPVSLSKALSRAARLALSEKMVLRTALAIGSLGTKDPKAPEMYLKFLSEGSDMPRSDLYLGAAPVLSDIASKVMADTKTPELR